MAHSFGKAAVVALLQVMQTNAYIKAHELQNAIHTCLLEQQSLYEYESKLHAGNSVQFAKKWSKRLQIPFLDISQIKNEVLCENKTQLEYQYITIKQPKQNLIAFADPLHWPSLKKQFPEKPLSQFAIVDSIALQLYLATKAGSQNHSIKNSKNNSNLITPYLNQMLEQAIATQASDIHIEPQRHHVQIRFRIDGILHPGNPCEKSLQNMIISRIKILSNLDIAERRHPQDGRFTFKSISQATRDCRVNCCPTLFGEKIVIRLLNPQQKIPTLEELGMRKRDSDCFLKAITKPQGLILVTGPTGSGKTLSLYTALNQLNEKQKNISSIEDPIEITMPGINQVAINKPIGFDFKSALRAFLRQDPDVIMIGEIRDQETATMAIRAAQTGHLVLATLHSNNAAESILRLKNLKIDNFNIGNALSMIIAQRLLRKTCTHCQGKQCQHCHQGYQGRTGIFEVIDIDHRIRNAIIENQPPQSILELATKKGTQSLAKAALALVSQNTTSAEEAYRVTLHDEV